MGLRNRDNSKAGGHSVGPGRTISRASKARTIHRVALPLGHKASVETVSWRCGAWTGLSFGGLRYQNVTEPAGPNEAEECLKKHGVPNGIRTRVTALKARCPGPARRWGRRKRAHSCTFIPRMQGSARASKTSGPRRHGVEAGGYAAAGDPVVGARPNGREIVFVSGTPPQAGCLWACGVVVLGSSACSQALATFHSRRIVLSETLSTPATSAMLMPAK